MTGVLDRNVVAQLQALARAGNPGLLGRLQAAFARDTPDRLQALRSAVAARDGEGVAANVHAVKGAAASLGAIEIVATCERIESCAADARALEPLLAALERHAQDAQDELALLAEAG
jgi:two-component system, sensor histidine kinase and response regulator